MMSLYLLISLCIAGTSFFLGYIIYQLDEKHATDDNKKTYMYSGIYLGVNFVFYLIGILILLLFRKSSTDLKKLMSIIIYMLGLLLAIFDAIITYWFYSIIKVVITNEEKMKNLNNLKKILPIGHFVLFGLRLIEILVYCIIQGMELRRTDYIKVRYYMIKPYY